MGYFSLMSTTWGLIKNYNKPHQEILQLKEQKFRNLIKFTYHNSPFYHEYYKNHGINEHVLDDIPMAEIPPISKELFVDNFDRIVTDNRLSLKAINEFLKQNENNKKSKFLNQYTIIHSSGSTGKPTCFIYEDKSWEFILGAAFRACKGDYEVMYVIKKALGGARVAYIAATEGRFGGAMAASSGIKNYGFRSLLLNVNTPLDKWLSVLQGFNPNIIIGYPSALKILCDLLRQNNITIEMLRVVTVGEPLTRELREYIQSTLGTEVFNIYGASESIIIGLETDSYDGFYVFDDINYLEIDEECTYITPLYNYAQPLIRYKLNDRLEFKERGSYEYLPYTRAGGIIGRNEEAMWFTNEDGKDDFLHPLIIYAINVDGIIKYQFVQLSGSSFEVRIELKQNADFNNVSQEFTMKLSKILQEKNLSNLDFQINQVNQIPIDPISGKSRLVIKEIN